MKFWVGYTFKDSEHDGHNMATMVVDCDFPPRNSSDVKSIQEQLKQYHSGVTSLIVLSWNELPYEMNGSE